MEQLRSRPVVIGLAIAVSVLGCACALAALVAPFTASGSGLLVEAQVCVGVIVHPRAQVGVWWQIVYMSRLNPAALSPYARCGYLPWPDPLPPAGEIALPP